jgi:hypothetical protein
MINRREILGAGVVGALAASTLSIHRSAAEESRLRFVKAAEIAEAGFIFGLPLVMNYAVMNDFVVNKNSGQWKAPFNAISNEARVFTYKDTTVITPNSDTPYSMLWLDLGAEPIVISVPAVDPKRYYSVQLVDGNTYIYGYIGSRATGNDAGDYMIAGPDWKGDTPPSVKKLFRSGSRYSLVIFRTQLFDPQDMPNVVKVQSGYKAQPLSAFLKQPAPAALPEVSFPVINKELVKTNFFEYLDFALQFSPPQANEAEIRAKLAQIGVGPGKTFNFKDLSLEDKAEIVLGMKAGEKKVEEAAKAIGKELNGWHVGASFGNQDFYNGDWLLRAAGAKAGIYGNAADEAMYPQASHDGSGNVLDGSKANYTLTFAAGQLPPVDAFWSVTMYDGKTQLLIQNPIDRYLINSPMLANLKKNADGSITLYVQHKSPGGDKESNWLPAPDGPIYMVMRLYWPKKEAPSILPAGAGTWRPPAIQKV